MSVDPVQATATPEPQAGSNPPATPAPVPPQASGPDGEAHDPVKAQRLIDNLRNEIKELKPKAQAGTAAQQRLQEIEDANKTELEKAQAKVAALEAHVASAQAAHRDALIRAAIDREAHAQGAVDADAVYALLDRAAIDLDDAGAVKGADKSVKALLEAKPYLKAQQAAGAQGVPGTPKANGSGDQQEAERARQAQGSWLRSRF